MRWTVRCGNLKTQVEAQNKAEARAKAVAEFRRKDRHWASRGRIVATRNVELD